MNHNKLKKFNEESLKNFCGVTTEGKLVFRGDVLFELKATHGFPVEFALDMIMNKHNIAVDWVGFIEAARKNEWWDFQTYEFIQHALVDAEIPLEEREQIILRFKWYVLQNEHPKMLKKA